ncbi:MAG: PIN/TRAM domain-containing protein [Planctomycetes bacterium]|nr:PIN/TRAM domain-containing protein [Planctomycetota bacterium]
MLHILRGIFVLISAVIGWHIEKLFTPSGNGLLGVAIGILLSLVFIVVEFGFTRRFIGTISIVMFSVVFGFIISSLFISAMNMLDWVQKMGQDTPGFQDYFQFAVTFLFCFLSMIAIIRSKDDFKFVIPFVELSRKEKGGRPLVIDTSVIIDGRITAICETGIIDGPIIVPKFILQELQNLADLSDRLKRVRGRHGLEILDTMLKNKKLDIQISDVEIPYIEKTDDKLVKFAQNISGRLLTNDFNLAKVAQVQGVDVVNVNTLANALRPVVLPSEPMEIKIVRQGEEPNQDRRSTSS